MAVGGRAEQTCGKAGTRRADCMLSDWTVGGGAVGARGVAEGSQSEPITFMGLLPLKALQGIS